MKWLVVSAVLLAGRLALACPQCAQNSSNDGFFWILGAMILLPFPAAGLVAYIIKRGERDHIE